MSKLACLFPGQGSQIVGMGCDLWEKYPVAKTIFGKVDKLADRSLSNLCFLGPEQELKRTINTQPTVFLVSAAAWKCYEHLGGCKPDFVAGHSLGEFSALFAAGVLGLEEAFRLVNKRAQLMEQCPFGCMSAIIGMSASELECLCRETEADLSSSNEAIVLVANFNTREQLVISGSKEAVELTGMKAKNKGAKVIPLPVGGAFHSPLMSEAKDVFACELATYTFANADIEIVQNYDAKPSKSAIEIKAKLTQQMSSPVRWYETIEYMLAQGVAKFIEIGPGKVLTGMIKKIDKSAEVFSVADPVSLEATLSALSTKCSVTK